MHGCTPPERRNAGTPRNAAAGSNPPRFYLSQFPFFPSRQIFFSHLVDTCNCVRLYLRLIRHRRARFQRSRVPPACEDRRSLARLAASVWPNMISFDFSVAVSKGSKRILQSNRSVPRGETACLLQMDVTAAAARSFRSCWRSLSDVLSELLNARVSYEPSLRTNLRPGLPVLVIN